MHAQLLISQGKNCAWKVLNTFTCCYVKCKFKMVSLQMAWACIFLWDHICSAVSSAGLPIARKTLQTAGSSAEGHRDDWSWSTCLVSRGWGSYIVQPGKRRLRGHLILFLNYWMGGYREYGARLFLGMYSERPADGTYYDWLLGKTSSPWRCSNIGTGAKRGCEISPW